MMSNVLLYVVIWYSLEGLLVASFLHIPGVLTQVEGRPVKSSLASFLIVAIFWPLFVIVWTYNTFGPRR